MAWYEEDLGGLREYLRGVEVRRALFPAAVRVMGRAKSLAASHVRTGHYLASFRYETGVSRGRRGRSYVRVMNVHPAAAPIEAQQHILGRAAG